MNDASADGMTPVQVMAFADETRAVVELSRRGIEEIWNLDAANDFVHLPLQLLAQGFERLLKLTFALALLKRDGELPGSSVFRGRGAFGHDLLRLTDDLVSVAAAQSEYVARPAVREDIAFIQGDPELRRILHLLSTFGRWSRYYRFEEFLAPESVDADDDPDREWQDIEMQILRRQVDGSELLSDSKRQEVHRRIAEHITGILERFARAITRMWTLGALHEEARSHLGVINDFLFLRDRDLGASPLPRRDRQGGAPRSRRL